MNWISGLHNVGVVLIAVGTLGSAAAVIYVADASDRFRPINWKRIRLSVAALLVTLLAGAFIVGATA